VAGTAAARGLAAAAATTGAAGFIGAGGAGGGASFSFIFIHPKPCVGGRDCHRMAANFASVNAFSAFSLSSKSARSGGRPRPVYVVTTYPIASSGTVRLSCKNNAASSNFKPRTLNCPAETAGLGPIDPYIVTIQPPDCILLALIQVLKTPMFRAVTVFRRRGIQKYENTHLPLPAFGRSARGLSRTGLLSDQRRG
jgi:hypothetical protein